MALIFCVSAKSLTASPVSGRMDRVRLPRFQLDPAANLPDERRKFALMDVMWNLQIKCSADFSKSQIFKH
jgi:hypothetical protein